MGTPALIREALLHGDLVEEDTILDDEPDSPTEGRYFKLYRATAPEPEV